MDANWRARIKDVYLAASGQEGEDRQRYLNEACGDDEVMRREVESLLERDQTAVVAPGTVVLPSTTPAGTVGPTAPPGGTGDSIGRYRIISKLGEGGMGTVYEAEDPKLRRRIALKVLPESLARDPKALKRFKLEAHAVAALNHPSIVTLHSVEESEGIHFLTMELVRGEPLSRLIPEEGIDFKVLLETAIPLADGLRVAHEAGIVHRDLKPANVMVDRKGRVRILDFGVAKLQTERTGGPQDATLALTTKGVVVGTVPYMSPEQISGKPADPRSDIFSLGVILHEMAVGSRPFGGDSAMHILSAILVESPAPVNEIRDDLPEHLGRIVRRCLEKDPDLRFQTAEDLRNELADLLDELQLGQQVAPMLAEPSRAPQAAEDASRRDPSAEALGVALRARRQGQEASTEFGPAAPVARSKKELWTGAGALAVALAIAAFLWLPRGAPPLTDTDVVLLIDFVNSTGDSDFDGTLRQALAVKLEESPFLKLASDRQIRETMRFMGLEDKAPVTVEYGHDICQRQGNKALITGEIAPLGSSYVITLGAIACLSGDVLAREQIQASTKEQVLGAVGEGATSLRRKLGESLASVLQFDVPVEQATTSSLKALKAYTMGNEKRNQGKEAESIPYFQRAIELDPEFASAYARLGTVYINLMEWDKGVEQKSRAYALRDRVSELEKSYISAHYHADVTGDIDKQIEAYKLFRDNYPRAWTPSNNLAVLYGGLGRFDQEIVEARRAVELESERAVPYATLVTALMHQNLFDEALERIAEALAKNLSHYEIHQHAFGVAFLRDDEMAMRSSLEATAGTAGEAWLLHEAAGAAASRGRLTESRRLMRQAVEVSERFGFESQAAYFMAEGARREAAFGFFGTAQEMTLEALSVSRSRNSLQVAAITLAVAGATEQALEIIAELGTRYINDAYIQGASIPIAKAAVLLEEDDALGAVEILQTAKPYESRYLFAIYLRGVAYLAVPDPEAASSAFTRLLELRGVDSTFPVHTLAHLGMARAHGLSGEIEASRAAYREFFALVEEADAGLPLIEAARVEYADLDY